MGMKATLVAGAVVVAGAFGAAQLVPDSAWERIEGTDADGNPTVEWVEHPGEPRVPECRGFDALVPCDAAPEARCEGDGATVPLAVLAPTGLHGEALAAGEPPLLGLYSQGQPIPMEECGGEPASLAAYLVRVRDPATAWPGCLAGEVRWDAPPTVQGLDGETFPPAAPFTWGRGEVAFPYEVPGEPVTVEGPDGERVTVPGQPAVAYRTEERDVPVYQADGAAFVGRCCVPGCACAGRCVHVPPAPRVGHERGWECFAVPDHPNCPGPPGPEEP